MEIKSLKGLRFPSYAVREDGLVINIERVTIVKPFLTPKGYLRIALKDEEGVEHKLSVHRLVAEVFIVGKSEKKSQVNHLNGNKLDNHFTNLEWCTAKENSEHAWSLGLAFPNRKKLTEEQLYLICNLNLPINNIAEIVGESPSLVCYHRKVNGVFIKEE